MTVSSSAGLECLTQPTALTCFAERGGMDYPRPAYQAYTFSFLLCRSKPMTAPCNTELASLRGLSDTGILPAGAVMLLC